MTTYNMAIETADGVTPHGYHLGTILPIAEKFVFEELRKPGVISVALYRGAAGFGGNLVYIYDFRHLPENESDML